MDRLLIGGADRDGLYPAVTRRVGTSILIIRSGHCFFNDIPENFLWGKGN